MTRTSCFTHAAGLLAVVTVSMTILGCDRAMTEPVPLSRPIVAKGGSRIVLPALSSQADLPSIDETLTDVDMCAAVAGLCGAPTCPLGSVDDPKGTGFSLKGCGNITKFVFKTIKAKVAADMGLDVQVNTGDLTVDPGCLDQTVTIPGTPGIPPTPPIVVLGVTIWPGTPGVPAVPPHNVDVLIPPGCTGAPRLPSTSFTPPSMMNLKTYVHPNVDVEVELDVAGNGEVDLRIPIPKATVSTPNPLPLGLQGFFPVSAAAGAYLTLKGRLVQTPIHLVAKVQDEFVANFAFAPQGGWTGSFDEGAFAITGSVAMGAPDTVQLRYGVQPAVSVLVGGRSDVVGIQVPSFQAQAGLWVDRYFENILTSDPSTGNLKNDANAGLEGRIYAAFKNTNPGIDPCDRAAMLDCPIDLGGALDQGFSFNQPFTCCPTDIYEQYGIGQFHFRGKTTGATEDLDPDGYTLSWTRAGTSPYPYVDSVMTTLLGTNGEALYPNVQAIESNLPSNPFGLVTASTCTEVHADGVITMTNIAGALLLPELRRILPGIFNYSKIIGCANLPADYVLTVSGLAQNCTVQDPSPRVIHLHPILNLSRLQFGNNGTSWAEVADPTLVDVNVYCRPRVGDLRVTATTTGIDLDTDGYALGVDGTALGNVGANAATTIAAIRVGHHALNVSGVAFNCAVSSPNPQGVDIAFETTTAAAVQVSCVSVYSTACTMVMSAANAGQITPDGTATSLCQKLQNADAARNAGDLTGVKTLMDGFSSELAAQRGKHVDAGVADALLAAAAYISTSGYFMP